VTLLDTNALVWLAHGHPRARALVERRLPLRVSPSSLIGVQFLIESGRIRLKAPTLDALGDDPRWIIDSPPSEDWFRHAWALSWTRDPFDRLIVAHAQLRGWRLATGDEFLLAHLGRSQTLAL
jgi:PIN domain nuclease of toxin-antitoxin system